MKPVVKCAVVAIGGLLLLSACKAEGGGTPDFVYGSSADAYCAKRGYVRGMDDYANCVQKWNDRQSNWNGQNNQPPKFDRQGNPNYDANGNYIGPHGVGQLVGPEDNPDNNSNPNSQSSSTSDTTCTNSPDGLSTRCHSTSSSNSSSNQSCTTVNGVTSCD